MRIESVEGKLSTPPNKALHLTAYSVRCAPASGSR